jgi:hypothetical protein
MAFNETNDWGALASLPWVAVIVNFAAYGWVSELLRRMCYSYADRLLGREDVDDSLDSRPERSKTPERSEIESCLSEK